MNAITSAPRVSDAASLRQITPVRPGEPTTREAFRDLVAGTFYKQMLAELRSSEKPVPYIGGGRAEEVFREQLDQTLAENFAASHGDPLVAGLYEKFRTDLAAKSPL
ncbi:MAG: rod-binding protein [Planctomycetota bacterium]